MKTLVILILLALLCVSCNKPACADDKPLDAVWLYAEWHVSEGPRVDAILRTEARCTLLQEKRDRLAFCIPLQIDRVLSDVVILEAQDTSMLFRVVRTTEEAD